MQLVADLDSVLADRRRALQQTRGRRRLVLVAVVAAAVLGFGGYKLLAMSPAFSVTAVDVSGATPQLSAEITRELDHDGATGTSLLETDAGALETRLEKLPYVKSATVDRAFPHTLAVSVDAYSPAVFVQSGKTGWLVAQDGRVLAEAATAPRRVARITIPPGAVLEVGDLTGDADVSSGLLLLRAAPRGFHTSVGRVNRLTSRSGTITAVVGHHIQLRFGEPVDLPLKMAVVERVMRRIHGGQRRDLAYLDVSAPGRPALGLRTTPPVSTSS
jgi:cell division protein FtsQ